MKPEEYHVFSYNEVFLGITATGVGDLVFAGKEIIESIQIDGRSVKDGISLIFPFEKISEKIIFAKTDEEGISFFLKEGFVDEFSFNFEVTGGISLADDGIMIFLKVKRIDKLMIDIPIDPKFEINFKNYINWGKFLEQEGIGTNQQVAHLPLKSMQGEFDDNSLSVDFLGNFSPDKSSVILLNNGRWTTLTARLLGPKIKREGRLFGSGDSLEMGISLNFSH